MMPRLFRRFCVGFLGGITLLVTPTALGFSRALPLSSHHPRIEKTLIQASGQGFGSRPPPQHHQSKDGGASSTPSRPKVVFKTGNLTAGPLEDPLASFTPERCAELFQFFIRDLQVEGVPLLQLDGVSSPAALRAAVWTVMSELLLQQADDVNGTKACLILEEWPEPAAAVDALRNVVDDVMAARTRGHAELERFSLSLLGKGVGPAMVINVGNITDTASSPPPPVVPPPNLTTLQAAMEDAWKSRSTEGLVYRVPESGSLLSVMTVFWTAVCELKQSSENGIVLGLPPMDEDYAKTIQASWDFYQEQQQEDASLQLETVKLESDEPSPISAVVVSKPDETNS